MTTLPKGTIKTSPLQRSANGHTWTHQDGDTYLATGIDRSGRRFKIQGQWSNYIRHINVWRGSKWLVRDGKKYLIQRITN